ncbi:MAG: hypothetical protein A2312_01785 [Candidatus Staskawiczbacteria bacterium RIFOXYB2_FULL_32_9]|uniref:Uncharacterized protein n=1 Tax=Candidatus Staskawiczbacteria bacterium RIFOXYD1_FULL_32_13 TaxID=1802234 RepID=A0A1G2JNE7_9BACT|nr:MAG: hypothetical protein UR22_C0010G0054 [Parcubacteria group bacterium GW2011_GWC2_32_10]OGZ79034.1 MAG: hypothetical protein A2360_03160 [Candidatus Staskawiczbacteria bacterium RIFOXYB1_FULL_32_11]OGZ79717.1 MAG: hypothetical protein A2256_01795 [Candidatus Staskawiczbacteria bacterium RIFOXYA2_FULL_32_7]OGZ82990.1 MAG: hypothetical protein A2312_01785 [Candidatus Staskawiczbacteria bacterium RIFOXYB2_FULL_32_9]OGZ87820.1 MAG: hypothetical protein A2561_04430 [Candidatus Staskawiczbacter
MRINQLLVVRTPDTALNTEEIDGKIYRFAVVILQLADGSYTWRGEDQFLPKARFVAVAELIFEGDDDESDEWPLEIEPIAVDMNGTRHYFGTQAEWEELPFDDHDVNWATNRHGRLVAAQYRG